MRSIVFCLLVLAGCKGKVAAKVGDFEITQAQVDMRNKMIALNNPDKPPAYPGLTQMIRAYRAATILKNLGREITKEHLKIEGEKISKFQKPEYVERIHEVFGDDDDYLYAYVLPTIAEQTLRVEYFYKDPIIHQKTFMEASEKLATPTAKLFADPKAKTLVIDARERRPWTEEAKGIPDGSDLAIVVDNVTSYLIVKKDKNQIPGKLVYNTLDFPKAQFEPWFEEQSKNIKVELLTKPPMPTPPKSS